MSSSPTVPPASSGTSSCPRCGQLASGRFCASCGAPLAPSACPSCGVGLTAGARFCHRCGTPAGLSAGPAAGLAPQNPHAQRGFAAALPWAVAAIALVALVALVVGQRVGAREMGRQTARTAADGGAVTPGGMPQGRAPDISNLSPEERAERLFDRIMSYSERGRQDSVQLFAPMAVAAFEMLPTLNEDHRYDLGRIGEVSGDLELAKAQADTLLSIDADHLLGLILAGNAARRAGDDAAARRYDERLAAAARSGRSSGRREYLLHKVDIDQALARVRP